MIEVIKAVLFDFDGTLINTNDLIIETYRYTVKKHLNKDIDVNELVKHFGEPLIKTLEGYDKEHVNELVKTYMAYNELKHDSMVRPFKGVNEGVTALRNSGIKVAIVTSKRRAVLERGMKLVNLDGLFDGIVSLEDTKEKKPGAGPALKGCEILNVNPSETIMVGDSHFDILCGRNAGCYTCLVSYTLLDKKFVMSYKPDFVVDSIMELKGIVEEQNKEAV